MNQNCDFSVPEDQLKRVKDELQPKERPARDALAEAVAAELGHRPELTTRR
jgi:hypothetical protein